MNVPPPSQLGKREPRDSSPCSSGRGLGRVPQDDSHTQRPFMRVSAAVSAAKSRPTLLRPHRLYPAGLLCAWDFPGKIPGVGRHFLLQGIFVTQGSNPGFPHCGQTLFQLSHQEARMGRKSSKEWTYVCVCSVAQLCPTLRDPMDCSPPGSSVHRISQEEHWSGSSTLRELVMDREDWRAAVRGVAKSRARLGG